MSIELDDIYLNINNNKIYVDLDSNNINNNKPNKIKIDNIFHNIKLKYIQNNNNNNNIKFIKNQISYLEDSFFKELSYCLYLRAQILSDNSYDFKNILKEFVNKPEGLIYIKSLNNSYKKLQINLNNILNQTNIDTYISISNELIYIICYMFDINIIIIMNNIYKIFEINKNNEYLIFKKHIVEKKNKDCIIYKIDNVIQYNKVDELITNLHIYKSNKELKNLKANELKNLCSLFKINQNKIKNELINDLINKYNEFN